MNVLKLIISIIVVIVIESEAARILAIYPTPSISHQVVFRPLTIELAKRGHEVIVITTDPAFPNGDGPANLTEIDVHDISYNLWREEFMKHGPKGTENDLLDQSLLILNIFNKLVEKQFSTDEVQAIIRDKTKKFDLLMVEACVRQMLGVSHIIKAPLIQVSSFGSFVELLETFGAPSHPILYPTIFQQKLSNLTLYEKLKDFYNHYYYNHVAFKDYLDIEHQISKRIFGDDVPKLSDLKNNIDMLFLNVHPIWETNRPVPPNIVFTGGLHLKPEKPLPQDLKTYLDSSKNGVIYVSFGTNVNPSQLPPEKLQTMVKVFSRQNYDILFKWDKDELPGRTDNIKISKWLPQSDLLRHPKIKLFITQGGLQSTDEAINAGVPLIGIPMIGDQWYNVELYVKHKVGIKLNLGTLTEGELENAIHTVINDTSYRENMKKLSSIMRDQPQSSLERAVWWTEYVLRHGGAKHLRSSAFNMSLTQYYEIEIIVFSAALLLVAVFVSLFWYTLVIFNRCLCRKTNKFKTS